MTIFALINDKKKDNMRKKAINYSRFILLVLCCGIFTTATAQGTEESPLRNVKPGSRINMVMDFSKAQIMGMSETDFADYEEDWYKDKPSIASKYEKGISSRLGKILRVGAYPEADYTLRVTVRMITDTGNLYCDAAIVDAAGQVLFSVKNISGGKEPPFLPGTKLAKMKVWAVIAGRALGGVIKRTYVGE